jgi:hypothetical protein
MAVSTWGSRGRSTTGDVTVVLLRKVSLPSLDADQDRPPGVKGG